MTTPRARAAASPRTRGKTFISMLSSMKATCDGVWVQRQVTGHLRHGSGPVYMLCSLLAGFLTVSTSDLDANVRRVASSHQETIDPTRLGVGSFLLLIITPPRDRESRQVLGALHKRFVDGFPRNLFVDSGPSEITEDSAWTILFVGILASQTSGELFIVEIPELL